MALRRSPSRAPLVLAFFIALSGACGGSGDEGTPGTYEVVPGPNVPQPPAERSLEADGEVTITGASGQVTSAEVATKISNATATNFGDKSGYILRMSCGSTATEVRVELYFAQGKETYVIERLADRWTVEGSEAEVVPSSATSVDAGTSTDAGSANDAGDAGAASDGGLESDAGDAGVTSPPPAEASFQNGVGLPGTDGRREIRVTLVAEGVRYDIRATIPWLESNAPSTCTESTPGTKGSGGCGSGSSSRRSSGGDWD